MTEDNRRKRGGSKPYRRIPNLDDEFTSMKKTIKLLLPHFPPDDLLELQRMIHQELRHYTNVGTDDR
jgi:hypothetical protein